MVVVDWNYLVGNEWFLILMIDFVISKWLVVVFEEYDLLGCLYDIDIL